MSGQRGSSSVEVAMLGPVIVLLIWLVIWAGTATQVPGGLQVAVEDAARLASVTRSASARDPVAASLVDERMGGACGTLTVETATTGQLVTVTATCTFETAQSTGLGVPARTTVAVGRSTIDPYTEQTP